MNQRILRGVGAVTARTRGPLTVEVEVVLGSIVLLVLHEDRHALLPHLAQVLGETGALDLGEPGALEPTLDEVFHDPPDRFAPLGGVLGMQALPQRRPDARPEGVLTLLVPVEGGPERAAIDGEWFGAVLPEPAADGSGGIWSAFAQDTEYFGIHERQFMVNFRVADRDAMLSQLRAAGCDVDEATEDSDFGRFGWVTDPEGNRVELWEPPAAEPPA